MAANVANARKDRPTSERFEPSHESAEFCGSKTARLMLLALWAVAVAAAMPSENTPIARAAIWTHDLTDWALPLSAFGSREAMAAKRCQNPLPGACVDTVLPR